MAKTVEKRPRVRKVFQGLVNYPTADDFAAISEASRQEEVRLEEMDKQISALESKLNRRRVSLIWANQTAVQIQSA